MKLRPSLNPALSGFWRAKTTADGTPVRNRILHGGRASSKSWDTAGFATFLATNYAVRFLCVRQFQNRITDSVYSLLKIQINRFGVRDQFEIQKRTITSSMGSEFLFYGLARNIDEIKSLESVDVLWIEEAHSLTKEQWEILEPTIRKEGSQVWISFNPKYVNDFVYQRFIVNPPPGTLIRQINWNENPFLSKTMHTIIANAYAEDKDEADHIYGGVPLVDEEGAVIKMSWIEAAVDAHLKLEAGRPGIGARMLEGDGVMGFDVADGGADKCANVYRKGSIASWADEWKAQEDELPKSAARTYKAAQAREAAIRYDSIGVGASAGAHIDALNRAPDNAGHVRYLKFNAGEGVFEPERYYVSDAHTRVRNKEHFANAKAQAWWTVADRFRNTYNAVNNGAAFDPDEMISLDSTMPMLAKLKAELATPKRDFDNNGKVKVESKKDLIDPKRDGGAVPSPNLADAFIMAFAPGKAPMAISKGVLARAGVRRRE